MHLQELAFHQVLKKLTNVSLSQIANGVNCSSLCSNERYHSMEGGGACVNV